MHLALTMLKEYAKRQIKKFMLEVKVAKYMRLVTIEFHMLSQTQAGFHSVWLPTLIIVSMCVITLSNVYGA
jgi:hypothetical protein